MKTKAIKIPRPKWCQIPKGHGPCNVNREHTHCLLAECNTARVFREAQLNAPPQAR